MIVAGIGCRAGCAAEVIVALVERAALLSGRAPEALAAPSFKSSEVTLHEAAAQLNLTILWVGPAALAAAQARCETRSARVAAAVGVASVAEGVALAAAGPAARLILARIADGFATCALAEGDAA